ncbi:hypothetical protein OUZ56_033931 [Daphnia magna]|uniref:Uncharacterized protein n=1 Tax=Daphnia magna TaxID=35525 RepID=A0ABQ9ZYE2_9CRUS|nr:hypothetical protein OUZ56_033931 [Daphnia magna]
MLLTIMQVFKIAQNKINYIERLRLLGILGGNSISKHWRPPEFWGRPPEFWGVIGVTVVVYPTWSPWWTPTLRWDSVPSFALSYECRRRTCLKVKKMEHSETEKELRRALKYEEKKAKQREKRRLEPNAGDR